MSPAVPASPLPQWDAGPVLVVGQHGTGTLDVVEGGQLSSSIDDPGFVGTYVGYAGDGDGSVTVSGTDMGGVPSSWQNGGFLSVGYYGIGTVDITDGAQVTSLWARIGTNAGSAGTVTVSGTDVFGNAATWATGPVMIGRAGTGTLTIENGGRVEIDGSWSMLGWLPGSAGTLNVIGSDGAGHASTFEGPSTFRVGYQGTGALNVTDGGRITTGESKIGFRTGSSGTALVSGTDADGNASLWENTGALVVGSQGQGTLTIEDGGRVTSLSGVIGEYSGSSGVVISGSDAWGNPSTWQIAGTGGGQLLVGRGSTGTLTVDSGGRLESNAAYIGTILGSVGAVTVSGTDTNGNPSTWTNADNLYVGYKGSGTLTIDGGATVTSRRGVVADQYTQTGHVHVSGTDADGNPSTWELTGPLKGNEGYSADTNSTLIIGHNGAASLTIDGGGLVKSQSTGIGANAGSVGVVHVSGTDASGNPSTLDSGSLKLSGGRDMSTSLTVDGGGHAVSTAVTIGMYGGSGQATVSGTDAWGNPSTWQIGGLSLGTNGVGRLTIAEGGEVDVSVGVTIGSNDYSGAAIVAGTDDAGRSSSLNIAGKLTVTRNGSLTVEDGGLLSTGSALVDVGNPTYGGRVTVSGAGSANRSTWTNAGELKVIGAVNVEDGGSVVTGQTIIGERYVNTGTVSVWGVNADGSASSWQTGTLSMPTGSGKLAVAEGGQFSVTKQATIAYSSIEVRGGEGDTRSTFEAGSLSLTGSDGTALSVKDGGIVDVAGNSSLLTGAVVSGTDDEGHASTFNTTGTLAVGNSSNAGQLVVTDGGQVSNAAGSISGINGRDSLVTVSGEGSLWLNSTSLRIGTNGKGTGLLTIADGGTVAVENGAGGAGVVALATPVNREGIISIGSVAGEAPRGAGQLQAASVEFGNGAGTLTFNHTDIDYEFAPALKSVGTGAHAINQLAGVTELTGDSSAFTGTTTVSGGTLIVADTLGGSALVTGGGAQLGGTLQVDGSFLGDVSVRKAGVVSGSGTIDGDVGFQDGRLAGAQGRTLTVTGDMTLDDTSQVDVALGAAVPSPELFAVGGDLALDGELNITDEGGFGLGVYRLFSYGGTLTDNGLTIGVYPAGIDYSSLSIQTSVSHQVNLVATDGTSLSFWDGGNAAGHGNGAVDGGPGVWDAAASNWTTGDGTTNNPYLNPSFAVFQGTPGTVSVDNSQGAIRSAGMQFASDGYRIEGDPIVLAASETIIRVGDGTEAGSAFIATIAADLTGDASLVKTDKGTLVLTGSNSYTLGTVIRDGTLSVASDASLGQSSGSVLLDGGTLATTADMALTRDLVITAAYGTVDVQAGTTLTPKDITGDGDLKKTGEGTLSLLGAFNATNSYRNTLVEQGTLIGTYSSIRGDVSNAGTVVFDQATNASFAGNIGTYNGVAGTMVKRGIGELTLTGTSTLDWTLEDGTLHTESGRFTGDVAIGSSATLYFDETAVSSAYNGRISGTGALHKTGNLSFVYNGDGSGFTGLTTVHTGSFRVGSSSIYGDAVLGGSFDVLDRGTLDGWGTVGSGAGSTVTLYDRGTIGTNLTVNADVVMQSGSIVALSRTASGTGSDTLTVTGDATLESGASLEITSDSGIAPGSSFTVLRAGGTLSGQFDTVEASFAFVDTQVAYDYAAGTVVVEPTRNDTAFASAAATDSQAATAAAIDSIGVGADNAVYDAVAMLPDDLALVRSSFDQLSGEIHASAKSVLIENSHFLRDAATARLRAAFGGVATPASPVMAYDGTTLKAVPADTAGGAFWAYGFGSWGSFDAANGADALNTDIGGVILGADAPVGDVWRLGVLAGYSSASFDPVGSTASGDSTDWHAGLYAGGQYGALGIRLGLAYSWSEIETARAVAIPGFSDSLNGDYDAGLFQVFGDVGYRFDAGPVGFEPFAALAYVRLDTDGFTEQGGAAALSAAGETTDTTFSTLGLRASLPVMLGAAEAVLNGSVGWRHAFGDVLPAATLAFTGSDAFTVTGVPVAEDAAVLEAGLDFTLSPDATLGVAYQGQFGGGVTQNGFTAKLSVKF
ncbi:autotransporter domain-containing protein [Ancylobacter sp. Lp-2]|uniref:autotransporter domain-containing protein n=1 Tax=Ancylobacter sp. Lp-2 TaxID=2881339 RepID=UPI001E46EFBC|nr:autotransporter domain-containing protein [Ancylobacter sp. Lp-2]